MGEKKKEKLNSIMLPKRNTKKKIYDDEKQEIVNEVEVETIIQFVSVSFSKQNLGKRNEKPEEKVIIDSTLNNNVILGKYK